VGIEWHPLDAPTNDRVRQFLSRAPVLPPRAAINRPHKFRFAKFAARRLARHVGIGGGLLAGLLCSLWILALHREGAQLLTMLHARTATLQALERQNARLRDAVSAASAHRDVTSHEVTRLSQQVQVLEGEAQQLTQDVPRLEASQAQLRQQRDALIERVLALEQERLALIRRSVPRGTLELAIREAIARRTSSPLSSRQTGPAADAQWSVEGNRGYLRWMGRHTAVRSPVRVRVHEPEFGSPQAQGSPSGTEESGEPVRQPEEGL